MSVVVDASVLVAATTDTTSLGSWAETVLADDLVAPHLVLVEATNILRRLEASRELSRIEASAAQHEIRELDVLLLPFAPFADRIWELRPTVTSYDAWYVAIAEGFGLALATLDRRLSRSSGPRCRFLLPR